LGVDILDYDVLLVDLDGVVWLGAKPLTNNINALKAAMEQGVRVFFVSNNSTRTRRYYAYKLRRLGLRVSEDHIVTSGYAAAKWVAERKPGSNVYVVGEEGLAIECYLAGLNVVDVDAAIEGEAEAVIVGLDRLVSYAKIKAALRSINSGALFVAANEDHVYPREDGLDPGAGSIVASIAKAAGREPDFVAGKPSPFMATLALEGLEGAKALIIGDRLDTDMEMARRAGIDGLLVLTGVTRIPPKETPPWVIGVVRSLSEALKTHS